MPTKKQQRRKKPESAPTQKQLMSRIIRKGTSAFGEGAFSTLDAAVSEIRCWYTSTVPVLDVILSGSVGQGFPSGRITELYGDEHAGKTTLGCLALRAIQQLGGLGVIFDTESTLTRGRAVNLGIDPKTLLYSEEIYLEPILDALPFIVEQAGDAPCGIFWDSIAGTPSQREREHSAGSGQIGIHARALSVGLRKLAHGLARSKTFLLACNQLKVGGIGKMYATERESEATLGGRAIRFHSHMRLRISHARKFILKEGQRSLVIGDEISAMVTKDKDRASGLRARSAVLVLQKVGGGLSIGGRSGTFNNGLSCYRTLQHWGAFGSGASIVLANHQYSMVEFVKLYDNDETFRERVVHRLLELVHAKLLESATVSKSLAQEAGAGNEEPLG